VVGFFVGGRYFGIKVYWVFDVIELDNGADKNAMSFASFPKR